MTILEWLIATYGAEAVEVALAQPGPRRPRPPVPVIPAQIAPPDN